MVDETMKCIRDGMISLLREKPCGEIQMTEIAQRSNIGRRTLYRYFSSKDILIKYLAESLMDRFAEEIGKEEELSLRSVIRAFFTFVMNNREELMIFKNAKMLGYIEEKLPELIAGVAAKTKYKGESPENVPFLGARMQAEEKYYFYFVFAGFWRVAMAWAEDDESLSPEQMTDIALKIMRRE